MGQDADASPVEGGPRPAAKNPRTDDRSGGGLTLIAGNTWGTRVVPRWHGWNESPRDLSLIGGARPADWPTSRTPLRRDTLVSARFTIGNPCSDDQA